MKHLFIRQTNTPVLDLIFAGWGMDANPFLNEPGENDLCICYDYSDLELNIDIFNQYSDIRLLAWSMGVWVAAYSFTRSQLPFSKKVAINGTLYPVDEVRGISPSILLGTLEHLSPISLEKFNRRMCGTQHIKSIFDACSPQRPIESIRSELKALYYHASSQPHPDFYYHEAVIGVDDNIFHAQNQRNAWREEKEINIRYNEIPHYPVKFLHYLEE